ncbi:type II secretion system protein D (GspD) [Nitrospirillum amazonense]|uniref:Type II secretion system protein D (GspD) n=1 Tax=Nitrospirillum amazonense TaxID=28077 RepID=A0A560FPX5_9PROT|nr:type II secretion system secretin GspD [Nitrospirillum amazonense]TWB23676.1 type II secretion system protein D (GspD) [Nitrospirillum amazonense]
MNPVRPSAPPRLLFAACLALFGCSESTVTRGPGTPLPSSPPAATAPVSSVIGPSAPPPRAAAQTVTGTGQLVRQTRPVSGVTPAGADAGEPVEMNFVNADVRSVLDAVLGGMLGLNYTIDPKVQGQVTIRTTRPLARGQALAAVDAALRTQGFAIIGGDGFYQVVPAADAAGQAPVQTPSAAERTAGFSTAIVPIRHVSVAELDKIVHPLTRQGFIQLADAGRNIFIVNGTAHEIESFTQLVASFDVDWLAGLSFSLHTLQSVEPARLEAELRRVLQLDGGPLQGMIDFVPINRLNALLVVAKRPELLPTVGTWIDRLDRPGPDGGKVVHFYEVQNGSAVELANALNRLVGRAGAEQQQAAEQQGRGRAGGRSTTTTTAMTASRGGLSTGASASPPSGSAATGASGSAASAPPSPVASGATLPGAAGEGGGDEDGLSELKGVRVVADERRNALLIFGSGAQYALLEQVLTRLDAPREQVLIEATIAEVTLNDQLNFGVQWFLDRGSSTAGFSNTNGATVGASYPNFNYTFLTPNTRVVLNALSSVTDVQVLSAPRLMVLNNETARLQVGDEVPVVVQSATSTLTSDSAVVNSVEYHDTGVILEVTPRINRSGAVVLDVNQEVSTVTTTTTSGIDSPTIQQRKITSVVNVQDGETVALGGLISDTSSRNGAGIPYLRDIPVLGKLFGTDGHTKGRTELLVFLRPVIVRDATRAREVTDALRASMSRLEIFAGATGGTPAPPPAVVPPPVQTMPLPATPPSYEPAAPTGR